MHSSHALQCNNIVSADWHAPLFVRAHLLTSSFDLRHLTILQEYGAVIMSDVADAIFLEISDWTLDFSKLLGIPRFGTFGLFQRNMST